MPLLRFFHFFAYRLLQYYEKKRALVSGSLLFNLYCKRRLLLDFGFTYALRGTSCKQDILSRLGISAAFDAYDKARIHRHHQSQVHHYKNT